jgi:hypothetical protein
MIVSKLETDLKVMTAAVTALEQTNEKIIEEFRTKDEKIVA